MKSTSPHAQEPPPVTRRHALFLDFDGTLTDIQDDPDTVRLPEAGPQVLSRLHEELGGAVAVISGRGVGDLAGRVPGSVWRVGGHGMDVCPPGAPPPRNTAAAPQALVEAFQGAAASSPGARLEIKGAVLAMHYRASPEIGPQLFDRLCALIDPFPDYRLQHGKMVIEAKPAAADKGKAVAALLRRPPFVGRTPVVVGDDVTDEDAMAAAVEAGGWAVKVGDGPSRAQHRLASPGAVWRWLEGALA